SFIELAAFYLKEEYDERFLQILRDFAEDDDDFARLTEYYDGLHDAASRKTLLLMTQKRLGLWE
ncbi:MAG: hypothetical protein U9Q82_09775, partial [Chloroflexota bacterium]|nr:hypothetical protein [Chloroflexota bacterium]